MNLSEIVAVLTGTICVAYAVLDGLMPTVPQSLALFRMPDRAERQGR